MTESTVFEIELDCGIKWCEWRNSQGDLHRTDGPAVVWADGRKEYWIQGVQLNDTIASFVENGLITLTEVDTHV
jgi:hypothetical protein